ncbi:MAG: GtrA family protein [Eubacteriaceae bacterium]|jgi:putative flippase GtrA
MNIKNFRNQFEELFRFGVNGVVCFIIDWGTMMLLMTYTDLPDWFSIGAGFTLSVIVNYIICVLWVFKGAGKQGFGQQVIFVGSSVVGLFLTEILMAFFMQYMGATPAKVIVTLIVMVWNYVFKRFAVYGMDKGKKD